MRVSVRECVYGHTCVCVCVNGGSKGRNIYIYMSHTLPHTHEHMNMYVCMGAAQRSIQGGEDAKDALGCRSLSAKEPQIIGLLCGK